jgi:type II secretory pathway component PulC
MTVRGLRANLWIVVSVLALSAAGAIAWTVFAPLGVEVSHDAVALSPSDSTTHQPSDRQNRANETELSRHWSKPLQRPLVDPTAPIQKPTAATPAAAWRLPLSVKLLGTIVEPGQTRAVIQTGTNDFEIRRVGDRLGGAVSGAELISIEDHHVVIRYNGQEAQLPLAEVERLPVTERR